MAFIPIGTVTTLAQALAGIRERTNTISEEESELYQLPLIGLLHDAILLIVAKQDPRIMKRFYMTEPTTVTEAGNLVDISALDIASADPDDLFYSDSANGQAFMASLDEFENLKTIYTAAMMSNMFFAYIVNTGDKLQIKTFRGSSLAAAGTLKLGYVRNPYRITDITKKLDCPEPVLRGAMEAVIQWIPERLKATA